MANAGQDLNSIRLDLHPPTASVPLLPSPELVIYFPDIDLQTARHTFHNGDQSFAMRFACGCEFEKHIQVSPQDFA
jgi:hypothetical protein